MLSPSLCNLPIPENLSLSLKPLRLVSTLVANGLDDRLRRAHIHEPARRLAQHQAIDAEERARAAVGDDVADAQGVVDVVLGAVGGDGADKLRDGWVGALEGGVDVGWGCWGGFDGVRWWRGSWGGVGVFPGVVGGEDGDGAEGEGGEEDGGEGMHFGLGFGVFGVWDCCWLVVGGWIGGVGCAEMGSERTLGGRGQEYMFTVSWSHGEAGHGTAPRGGAALVSPVSQIAPSCVCLRWAREKARLAVEGG